MATAPEVRQAAIQEAEAEIRRVLGRLVHQSNVTIERVDVLVQPSTFEVRITGR